MGLFKRKKKAKENINDEQQKDQMEEQTEKQAEFEKSHKNIEGTFMQNVPNYIDLISPEGITIRSEDYGKIKQSLGTETYFRPMYIPRDGYPRKLKTNWINNILSMGEIDVVFDIHKVKKNEAIRSLQRQETTFSSNHKRVEQYWFNMEPPQA